MPSHTYYTQIAASGQVDNLMDGTPYLYMPRNAVMRLYACQNGADPGDLRFDVWAGNTQLTTPEGAACASIGTAGQGPNKSDHLILREVVRGGVPLVIRVRNTDAVNASDPCILLELDWI